MKYIIFRTSDYRLQHKPCKNSLLHKYIGDLVRDDEDDILWIYYLELNSIDEVMNLKNEVGKIIIHLETASDHWRFGEFVEDDSFGLIEIYDNYRE